MIIYGSRMYFRQNEVKIYGDCEYCGGYARLTSYQATRFGHIYFIPLIPMGGKTQVMDECSKCEMGAHLPAKDLEPRLEAIREQFKEWITLLSDGQTEIHIDGAEEPVSAGVLISSMLHDLYCLNEIESIDSIQELLQANELAYDSHLVEGSWHDMRGDQEAARNSFAAASQMRPDEPLPFFQLGKICAREKNAAGAEQAFAQYNKLCPDDLSGYIELASMYERLVDYPKIVESYDELYGRCPDLISDKGMRKIYKKACKKSGMPGKFINQV